MGCLVISLIALIIIIALICGVVIELFWPIMAVVAAYYLIKWLNEDTSPNDKKGDE